MMQQAMGTTDQSSQENQKQSWEALRKSINGLINKVNVANIKHIVPELFEENLVRGRGLFARAIMKAQLASPGFTHIYCALIAVINTKLPENGELILKRVIHSFKRAYKRRDKIVATALAKFVAHLVNHQVAHELLALQLLTVLLEDPTDDSVEIAVNFVKEVGQLLEELSPQGLHAIFERFRGILHEGDIDKRVQYTIEGLFAIRKSGFKDYPAIPKELDLVEREDQITFDLGLDDAVDKEEMLDVFRFDPSFAENEKLWEAIKKDILGDSDDEEDEEEEEEEEEGGEEEGGGGDALQAGSGPGTTIVDMTEQDLINLRRTLYLTIMSSISFEECAHKILKLHIPEGYEAELSNMLVECCSNERSYLKYYGLLGQRFCMVHRKYQDAFDECFHTQYSTIHRLETNKLRNVAKFFAHLLASDALPWTCLEYIKLNEEDTTSSSRIFIKILTQELSEVLGLATLRERFSDPYMQDIFSGLFPRDNPRNTRFAINFFTSIGLGGLTDGLREHLKNAPKLLAQQMQALAAQQRAQQSSSSSSSSSSSDSSSSDSSSDSDSDTSSSSSGSNSSSNSSSSSSSSSSRSPSLRPRRSSRSPRSSRRPSPSRSPSPSGRSSGRRPSGRRSSRSPRGHRRRDDDNSTRLPSARSKDRDRGGDRADTRGNGRERSGSNRREGERGGRDRRRDTYRRSGSGSGSRDGDARRQFYDRRGGRNSNSRRLQSRDRNRRSDGRKRMHSPNSDDDRKRPRAAT